MLKDVECWSTVCHQAFVQQSCIQLCWMMFDCPQTFVPQSCIHEQCWMMFDCPQTFVPQSCIHEQCWVMFDCPQTFVPQSCIQLCWMMFDSPSNFRTTKLCPAKMLNDVWFTLKPSYHKVVFMNNVEWCLIALKLSHHKVVSSYVEWCLITLKLLYHKVVSSYVEWCLIHPQTFVRQSCVQLRCWMMFDSPSNFRTTKLYSWTMLNDVWLPSNFRTTKLYPAMLNDVWLPSNFRTTKLYSTMLNDVEWCKKDSEVRKLLLFQSAWPFIQLGSTLLN